MNGYASAILAATVSCAFLLSACSDDEKKTADVPDGSGGSASMSADGDDQTPAHGATKIKAWLEEGAYMDWACEPEVHAARSPSPHGFNRICSNDVLAADAAGTGNWKKGAAAVKELHASADSTSPVGYAVYEKTEDDSAGGANWYWYEIVPADSPFAPDSTGIVAEGMGDDGPPKDICVGCHAAAGSDAAHTPSPGGRDQVYTPVAP